MTLRWSRLWAATFYDGPIDIIDPHGVVTDMKDADSLVITDPTVTTLLIVAEGPVLTTAAAGEEREKPLQFSVAQNYPNPFNPVTTFEIALPRPSRVSLTIYDILGRLVTTLLDREHDAGTIRLSWDATGVPSGVYFYRLTSAERSETGKMLLLR